jgi:hypothetical protein
MSEYADTRPVNYAQVVIKFVIDIILARTRMGAVVRRVVVIAPLAIYWFILVMQAGFPGEVPAELRDRVGPFAYFILNLGAPFFHPKVLLNLLPVLMAILVGLFIGSLYLTDIFELDSFWIALQYLTASLFGLNYPTLRIDKGDLEKLEAENYSNPLVQIGGPGYLRVHLGFAAVAETEDGLPRVYGPPGKDQVPEKTFMEGFERLRAVIDLRDQLGKVPEVLAVTRDGVEVYARDAQMLFRVYSGGQERSLETPYPYTVAGIRRLAYGQVVQDEKQHKWEDALPTIVRREIHNFVARHTIEEFLALQPYRSLDGSDPEQSDQEDRPSSIHIPRRKLTESFHTDELRRRLQRQGLELAWVGVGTWEVRDEQVTPDAGVTGPGKTLTSTWRDLQRANIYASPDYQARQRDLAYRERIAASINTMIRTWKYGDFTGQYRCFGMLSTFIDDLYRMLRTLESVEDSNPPPDIHSAVSHINLLMRPKAIGDANDPEPTTRS